MIFPKIFNIFQHLPQVIETRMNSMFELATQEEIDKLKAGDESSKGDKSSEELQLDDLEVEQWSSC